MNELLKSLACSGTECFCWILVLFNILAVFYLVFCSFWKVSRLVRIFGWVHSGVLLCVSIVTLFYHTCIYTLLATIFTGMMLMAILSIILPQQHATRAKTERIKAPKPIGSYVISETFDGWFVFGIYDAKRRKLVDSTYAYISVDEAKEAILACRENGLIAETEDRSGSWIQEKYIPKFEVRKYGDKYGFSLYIVEEDSIVHSEGFDRLSFCFARLEKVKENIGTTEIYMSVDKLDGAGYKKHGEIVEEPVVEEPIVEEPVEEEPIVEEPVEEEPVVEEPIEEEPVEEEPIEEEPIVEEPVVEEPVVEEPIVEEPIVEEPIVEEPIIEEPEIPKKYIVGIVWPESSNRERVYRYNAGEMRVEVGDIVVVPTFDSYNKREVVRKARVVNVECYEEGEDIVLPKKSIISVEK